MAASTPISRSKSSALTRVLDAVPKGYVRWTCGQVKADKAEALARKFHGQYGIGCTPAQRITRKKKGQANALLAMYWPEGAQTVQWLLLATQGTGLDREQLRLVTERPRLVWLGYELVRRTDCERTTAWTWRRTKAEMAEHYALLAELSNRHHDGAVGELLQRLARQPGFHGVRAQTWELGTEARRRGYQGELPFVHFMSRISHGERLAL